MANVFYRFTLPIWFQTCSDMSIIGFSHKMSLTAISIQMTAYSVQQRQGSGCLCWPQSPESLPTLHSLVAKSFPKYIGSNPILGNHSRLCRYDSNRKPS